MASRADYIDYFRNIAINNVDIGHTLAGPQKFFTMNLREIIGKRRGGMEFRAMILERDEVSFRDEKSDYIPLQRHGAFSIIDAVESQNDFARELEVYDECEEIAKQIIARMLFDCENCIFFNYLSANDIRLMPIGPVQDNCYGIRVEFMYDRNGGIDYDPGKWTA